MADLRFKIDWDITEAEAKQRKLNRDMDISKQKAENINNKIVELNSSLENEKNKQKEIREEMVEQTKEAAKLALQIEKIKSGEASIQDFANLGGIDAAEAKLKEMETSIKKNEAAYEKVLATEKKITSDIAKQNLALTTQNAKTAAIGDKILLNSKKQNKFALAFSKSAKSAAVFGKRIGSLIKSALLFSVVTKAFTALREAFGKMITEQGTKTAQLAAQLKGNLAVIGTTLYESVRPAIEWLLNALVKITQVLAYGIAKILGKNVEEMKALTKQTKKAGEEAKKATAGFDTLQTVDTSSASSNSESGVPADFSALNSGLDDEFALLMTLISGATLVLGVILAFTGVNIPLGIGLIALGAIGLVGSVSMSWGTLETETKNTILIITAIVSTALLVLGAIFAFTGVNIPLGIAFLLLGAAGLVTATATSWNSLSDKTKEIIGIITIAVSSALLVLGVIFAFTGVAIGLGIAFMLLGAAGLVSAASLSWNSMSDKTKNVISGIMAIGGLLLLIIGILLCITGVGIPLGVALIALGAASLVGSVALNWNAITEKVKVVGNAIAKIFKSVWDGIKAGFKAMVNGIISLANLWIDGLNLLLLPVRGLIFGIAKAFGSDISLKDVKIPHIPKLATGAVIPGGSPFLAVLGDQRKGQTNIEAPLDTIVEAFKAAQGTPHFTIEATGSLSQLIRMLRLQIKQEDTRASIF